MATKFDGSLPEQITPEGTRTIVLAPPPTRREELELQNLIWSIRLKKIATILLWWALISPIIAMILWLGFILLAMIGIGAAASQAHEHLPLTPLGHGS